MENRIAQISWQLVQQVGEIIRGHSPQGGQDEVRRGPSNELLAGVDVGFAEDLRREFRIIDDAENQPLLIRVEMPQKLGHVGGMQLRDDLADMALAARRTIFCKAVSTTPNRWLY